MSERYSMVFDGPNQPFRRQALAEPTELSEGEVWVRLRAAAICTSDLWTYAGARSQAVPSVLGHEGFGVVEASARAGFEPGDCVAWSLVDTCGHCRYCTDYRLPQKCDALFKYGHADDGPVGTYATHMLVRSGTVLAKTVVPEHPGWLSVATCSMATALEAIRWVPHDAERVMVLGAGMVGLCTVSVLMARGNSTVLVAEPNPRRLQWAEALGGHDAAARPGPVDVVVECVGVPAAFHAALPRLRLGGTAVLAGMVHPDTPLEITGDQIVRGCLTLRGSHNYEPSLIVDAVKAAQDPVLLALSDDVFSKSLPLSDLDQAFVEAKSGRFLRTVLATS